MPSRQNTLILTAIFIILFLNLCLAQEFKPFKGKVGAAKINIRSDSTVSSQIICEAKKNDSVEVIQELYGWYKIRLPSYAPAFVKENLVELIENTNVSYDSPASALTQKKIAKVLKDKVNIRLAPNESSPIIGKVNSAEILNVVRDYGDWYKIEPTVNSFGWVHKKFVDKIKTPPEEISVTLKEEVKTAPDSSLPKETKVIIEGVVKPNGMFLRRKFTHKVIGKDNRVFLLKGEKEELNSFNNRKVKLIGKPISGQSQKYPIIEVEKMELFD